VRRLHAMQLRRLAGSVARANQADYSVIYDALVAWGCPISAQDCQVVVEETAVTQRPFSVPIFRRSQSRYQPAA
jgi:hypothetical protein